MPKPLRIAHRGDARHAAENTWPALLAAMTLPGCDGVEFDVRASRDGIPILLHDETLQRVQGRPESPHELTSAELGALGVPTLAGVLRSLGREPFIDIELKEQLALPVVEAVATARGAMPQRTAISSFDLDTVEALRRAAPDWPIWLNAMDLDPGTIELTQRLGCRGLSVRWEAIDERGIARARQAGLAVAAWTVTDRTAYEALYAFGIDVICAEGDALDA